MGFSEMNFFKKNKEVLGYKDRIPQMAKEIAARKIIAINPEIMSNEKKETLTKLVNEKLSDAENIKRMLPSWKEALRISDNAEETEKSIAENIARDLVAEVQEDPLQKAA